MIDWLFNISGRRQIMYQREEEAELLLKAVEMTEGPILEIGRARGGTTVLMADACNGRHIYSIDLKNSVHPKCQHALENFPNVHLIVANSNKSLDVEEYGFALIDGDHSYEGVVRDTEAHWNQVKSNGLIIYHDYNLKPVARHVNDLINMGHAEIVERVLRSVLVKKLSNLTDNKFCIKAGYVENLAPQYCKRKASSIKNQFWIYEKAFEFTKEQKFKKVADLGCGYAGKLLHFFKDFNTVGFDYGENINYCIKNYPNREWAKIDLSNRQPKHSFENSLIICVDVIEHLVDPTCLLNYMAVVSKKNKMIVSTPNRALRKGKEQDGPPKHKDHVREWTKDEFQALLNQFEIDLTVEEEGRYLIAS